jgi:hypothetical protein
MHAHGACLSCSVPPVCTWGRVNAAAHRLGVTGKRTRPVGTPPPPVRRKRGACPAAAKRGRPAPPHSTPPPSTMGASETPPRFRRAAKRARSGPPSAPPRSRPSHARAREAPAPAAAAHPQRPHVPHFQPFPWVYWPALLQFLLLLKRVNICSEVANNPDFTPLFLLRKHPAYCCQWYLALSGFRTTAWYHNGSCGRVQGHNLPPTGGFRNLDVCCLMFLQLY